jgi:hypothetical protein
VASSPATKPLAADPALPWTSPVVAAAAQVGDKAGRRQHAQEVADGPDDQGEADSLDGPGGAILDGWQRRLGPPRPCLAEGQRVEGNA